MGTISAANLGRDLGEAIDGVILTSSVFVLVVGARLTAFHFSEIRGPLLFVHHAGDLCHLCPYESARRLGATYPLITVTGGRPAESNECGPLSAHSYFGGEAKTVSAFKNWILGRP